MMRIDTTRFGSVDIDPEDILLFPQGMMGFEEQRHWVLLTDDYNQALGWLQSVTRPDIAMPVVSPRRFTQTYKVQLKSGQLQPLELADDHQAFVLAVINRENGQITANLRAPVIINLDRRLGRQVVTTDEQPLRYVLGTAVPALRKSA
jgi:flagellar assembly factor FliW